MTARDAILRAIPVFAARQHRDVHALRVELERAEIPGPLAAEVVEFLPLAMARALLNGMGIQFADHYIRQTSQGHVIGEKALADEPVFREGLAMADEIVRMGEDTFMSVAGWSPEYQGISSALSAGSDAADLQCKPPIMIANNEDARRFDDTSGGVQPGPKRWWQFWK